MRVRPRTAIRVRPRTAVTIAMASFLGLVAFLWPFVVAPGTFTSTETPPLMFGVLLALVLAVVTPGLSLVRALTGGAVIGVFFLLFHLASRRGIGLGDVKLGALIGAVTGLGFDNPDHLQAIYAVTGGVFLGGAAALLLLITRLRSLKDPIPYGPFLCAGAVLVLFQGLPPT